MTDSIARILRLPLRLPPVLAAGAFLKNTLCLIQDNEAWLSHDNGSLENVEAIAHYEQTAAEMLTQAREQPLAIAHDLHPDFPSTHFALSLCRDQPQAKTLSPSPCGRVEIALAISGRGQNPMNPSPAKTKGLLTQAQVFRLRPSGFGATRPRGHAVALTEAVASSPARGEVPIPVPIQHHHAHIAAIMAEHGITEPVLGLALDGFGLGLNNESWGGELLRVDVSGFQRLGHLAPLPQPGGDIAARQPWRMGAAALWTMGRGDHIARRYAEFPHAHVLASMLERGLNCPMTTSAGRLFDAACGLLGVKPVAAFEGEAPMALEAMVRNVTVDPDGWKIQDDDGRVSSRVIPAQAGIQFNGREAPASYLTPLVLDLRPLLSNLIDLDPQQGAELFHGTLIAALSDWVQKAAEKTGIRSVALGGGCFFNKVLREGLCQRMMAAGLTPLLNQALSPGDAAISLGQAWAAALKLKTGIE